MTEIIKINASKIDKNKIKKVAKALREGKVVVFPTETVYGVGANALSSDAVKKIFKAKSRPFDNPFIVHVAYASDAEKIVKKIPEKAEKLIRKFWPGPLTLIFEKKKIIPDEVTAGLKSVAVRMPSNKIAHKIIKESKTVVAAPSANVSGKPSSTRAKDVIDDLNSKVDIIVDGGNSEIGIESTVLDMTKEIPVLLRPGKISKEEIEKEIGQISIHKSMFSKEKIKGNVSSPGMKYKHYSPDAQVILVVGEKLSVERKINEIISENNGKKIGVISMSFELKKDLSRRFKTKEELSKNLFLTFRDFDKEGVDVILVEGVDEEGIGLAIMNRLIKASYSIIKAF